MQTLLRTERQQCLPIYVCPQPLTVASCVMTLDWSGKVGVCISGDDVMCLW